MSLLREIIRNNSTIEPEEYHSFLTEVLHNRANKPTLIALLAALSAKSLNTNDVINFVDFIEKEAPKRSLSVSDKVINIVGTGGGISTFNVSTTTTFVAAAAGAMVLKSGSHSYNSQCGSLDVLSKLGINVNLNDQGLQAMIEELNIGFVSPKMYPPLLRRIAVSIMPLTLKEIGGFINMIGPLLCPFHVRGQICGVSSFDYIDVFATALQKRGMHNSIAVWSEIGMDEFSAIGLNHYATINQIIDKEVLDPRQYGMKHINPLELSGNSPSENAAIMESVLKQDKPTAAQDTVVLNAAFILKLSGQCTSIKDAILLAKETIDSGSAYKLLKNTIEFSNDYKIVEST